MKPLRQKHKQLVSYCYISLPLRWNTGACLHDPIASCCSPTLFSLILWGRRLTRLPGSGTLKLSSISSSLLLILLLLLLDGLRWLASRLCWANTCRAISSMLRCSYTVGYNFKKLYTLYLLRYPTFQTWKFLRTSVSGSVSITHDFLSLSWCSKLTHACAVRCNGVVTPASS